jgi:Ca2+-transporting ATPase
MILLVGAAAACFAVQEWVDGGVIAAIAVANVGLGVAQEARAEAALAALAALAATRAVVVRDGRAPSEVPAADLVPGDVIQLSPTGAGSAVPADAVVIEAADLTVVEATLTGEPVPAKKTAAAAAVRGGGVPSGAPPPPPLGGEQSSRFSSTMVYSGTQVATGKATAVILRTGMDTELGRIAARVGAAPTRRTRLQKEMARAGLALFAAGVSLAFVVFAANKFNVDNPPGEGGGEGRERGGGRAGSEREREREREGTAQGVCSPQPRPRPHPPHSPTRLSQACATPPSTPSPPSLPSSRRSCPWC